MPQAIDTTLFNKAAKKVNEGARAIAPEWLADFLAPPEASVELTDMLTPMGSVMSKGTGLLAMLGKKFGKAPVRTPSILPGPVSESKSKDIFDIMKRPERLEVPDIAARRADLPKPSVAPTVPSIKERKTHLVPNEDDAQAAYDYLTEKAEPKADNSGWGNLLKGLKDDPPGRHGYIAKNFVQGHADEDWFRGQRVLGIDPKTHESIFVEDLNRLENRATEDLDTMRKRLDDQGSLSTKMGRGPSRVNLPTVEAMKQSRAFQPNLPIDVPLVSHHPDVSPRVAEKASHTLNNLLRTQPGQPSDYVKTMYVGPESRGSAMSRGQSKRMDIANHPDINDVVNSVGHETQHAIDLKHNPSIFKDYPNLMFSELIGAPSGYYRHPSETIARAAGNLEAFKNVSRETGQGMLDHDFMKQMEHGNEMLRGELSEDISDMVRSGVIDKHRRLTTKNENIMSRPHQQKLEFPYGGIRAEGPRGLFDPETGKFKPNPGSILDAIYSETIDPRKR